jgi:hypothetical protein
MSFHITELAANAVAGRNAAQFNVAEQDSFTRRIVTLRVLCAVVSSTINLLASFPNVV